MAANIFRRGCRGGLLAVLVRGGLWGIGGCGLGAGRGGQRGAIDGFDCAIDGVEMGALTFNIWRGGSTDALF